MKLKPHNKYVWIKPIKEEEKEDTNKFFMPQDLVTNQHYFYEVIDWSDDCSLKLKTKEKVLVLENMVEEIKSEEDFLYVCPESAIIATVI
jgi:hypothetical protein